MTRHDPVNSPKHYTNLGAKCDGCGASIECIAVTEMMTFNAGNAMKYLWRHLDKGNPIEDLKKAGFYISREIERLEGEQDERWAITEMIENMQGVQVRRSAAIEVVNESGPELAHLFWGSDEEGDEA